MTTKPRAKKFRIRRTTTAPSDPVQRPSSDAVATPEPHALPPQGTRPMGSTSSGKPASGNAAEQLFAPADTDDGFGTEPFPTAAATARPKPTVVADKSQDEAIAEIRREGLTGRQLRMARRVAQKHGIAPTSDFDAVRLLRNQGIDPFQRANSLELVSQDKDGPAPAAAPGVPQTLPKPQLPSTTVINEDTRAREIIKMQRDIVKRRRNKLMQLVTRLAFFVMLPTFLAGYYYFAIATPMYSTKSEFVIQQSQNPAAGGAGGLGGLLGGSPLATSQDSIAVQGYLGSLEAMLRLEADVGFISHFSADDIDPLQRLETNATKEQAYKVYKKKVLISYDPTEGIIKMEVIAADPIVAEQFASKLIAYAEEQVDNLTQRLRGDQMEGATAAFNDAEEKMLLAQTRVQELQEKLGILDPTVESGAIMTQVTALETQLIDKQLALRQLLDNARPNQARVSGTRKDIESLEDAIARLRAQLTEGSAGVASMSSVTAQLGVAQIELQTRTMMMQTSLQSLETARVEANRQTRYLENSVKPIVPDTAAYPRAFENTILAFLIFGGIYLMFSLTASILREQVSA